MLLVMVGEIPIPHERFAPLARFTTERRNKITNRLSKERERAINSVMHATVSIGVVKEVDGNRVQEGLGSGFILGVSDKRVIIATNKHVVSDALNIVVETSDTDRDGNPREKCLYQKAEVLYQSPNHDVAFIAIDPREHPDIRLEHLKLRTKNKSISIGHSVLAIGSPLGLTGTVSDGYISRKEVIPASSQYGTEALVEISANLRPGSSGGPIIDPTLRQSPVVGMADAQAPGESGIAFMVPVSSLIEDIKEFTMQEATKKKVSSRSRFTQLTEVMS